MTRPDANSNPAILRRPGFESFVTSLPAARIVHQWRTASVGKLGEKVFCLLDGDPGEIWLKVSDLAFAVMADMPGIRPAPYFGRAGWVAIGPQSGLSEDEFRTYLVAAHGLVAQKLSGPKRRALGLVAPTPSPG